jgi:LAO/AO transport system kinase
LKAERLGSELGHALHYLKTPTPGWQPSSFLVSALKKTGLEELWSVLLKFKAVTSESGECEKRRAEQTVEWMMGMVLEQVQQRFLSQPEIRQALPALKAAVAEGKLPATTAALDLLKSAEKLFSSTHPTSKDSL